MTSTIDASATAHEIASQPELWRSVAADEAGGRAIIGSGRALYAGCGTSAFMAQAIAQLREQAGVGEADAAFASEAASRPYDHLVAISRSATTTEVLDLLARRGDVAERVGVTAVDGEIAARFDGLLTHTVRMLAADERSVVQTRFPTTLLALVRRALGDGRDLAEHGRQALAAPLPSLDGVEHFVFLASGWRLGLANEAALKLREMAQVWSESHLALDYRHGPIAVAGTRSLVFVFGSPPTGLLGDLRSTGATVWAEADLDPLAQLVVAQRLGLDLCRRGGLDPDHPRGLHRSVILDEDA